MIDQSGQNIPGDNPPPAGSEAGVLTPSASEALKKHFPVKPFIIAVIFLFLVLISLSSVFYIAYGKTDNPFSEKISFFVQNLPLTPKTSEYVIFRIFEKYGKIKQFDYVLQMTNDASFMAQYLNGADQIQIKISGSVNYENKENPISKTDIQATPDIDLETLAKDKMICLKINNLPINLISSSLKLEDFNFSQFLDRWVCIDQDDIANQASGTVGVDVEKSMNDLQNAEVLKAKEKLIKFIKEEILPLVMMKKENYAGIPVYHLWLNLNKDKLVGLTKKIEAEMGEKNDDNLLLIPAIKNYDDYPQKIVMNYYLDQNTYYPVHGDLQMEMLVPDPAKMETSEASAGGMPIVTSVSMDIKNVGKASPVSLPSDFTKAEDFSKSVSDEWERVEMGRKKKVFQQSVSSVALLERVIWEYYVKNAVFPASKKDISFLPEDELKRDVMVDFVILEEGQSVAIFSRYENPDNPAAPYLCIVISKSKGRQVSNYSLQDLNNLLYPSKYSD